MTKKPPARVAWVWTSVGLVSLGVVIAFLAIVLRTDEPAPVVDEPTLGSITAPNVDSYPNAVALPDISGISPGDIVATISGETVSVYDAPGDATARENLGRFSYYGNARTFMGLETQEIDGTEWIHVQLPEYPNNSEGWIKADQVTTTSTEMRINVYLDEREVDLLHDGTVELTSTAVIGAPESPTPLGAYFVADPVDFTANPTGIYGAYALGLSAYSETLETFKGALPQIALHGTDSDQYFGEAVSNGCIRLPDKIIRMLAADTALGTPVVIYQSRGEPSAT